MNKNIQKLLCGLFMAIVYAGAADGQALLPNGQQQFNDANGAPLAAGNVYFYLPGTTAAKPTWHDIGESVPNTNPVVLDAAGRATIWGTGVYREIVYDQFGTLVWDQLTTGSSDTGVGAQQSIGSSATTDLGLLANHNVLVTGGNTITSFGSSASTYSPVFLLNFSGTATLVNSGALALPGGQNITAATGDSAWALYLGSGNWKLLNYTVAATDGSGGIGAQTNLASASTTDLGAVTTNNVLVTGTNTITSFGNSANTAKSLYVLTFQGALTLTQDPVGLILPTGASFQTAAGDSALALYLGAGHWQVVSYTRASGQPLTITGAESTLASSATTDLGAAPSHLISITGGTTISSFGSSASVTNPLYWLRFTGALQLTYNGASLQLPGGSNITTAAGDSATAQYLGGGNWKVLNYSAGGGLAPQIVAAGQCASVTECSIDWTGKLPASCNVEVQFYIVPASNNVSILGLYRDSGGDIVSGYRWAIYNIRSEGGNGGSENDSDTSFTLGLNVGNLAGANYSGTLKFAYNSGTATVFGNNTFTYTNNASHLWTSTGGESVGTSGGGPTGLSLEASSGNITVGYTVTAYPI